MDLHLRRAANMIIQIKRSLQEKDVPLNRVVNQQRIITETEMQLMITINHQRVTILVKNCPQTGERKKRGVTAVNIVIEENPIIARVIEATTNMIGKKGTGTIIIHQGSIFI